MDTPKTTATLLALLTVGCSPDKPRASFTAEICDTTGVEDWEGGARAFSPPRMPSVDCVYAILQDFNANTSLEEFSDASYVDLMDPEDEAWGTPLGFVVGGGYALLHYEWGKVDNEPLEKDFRRMEKRYGRDPNGWQIYDWVTTRIGKTISDPDLTEEGNIAYSDRGNALVVNGHVSPPHAAGIMTHHARHADGCKDHIECPSTGEEGCDIGYGESIGAQMAVLSAGVFAADPDSRNILLESIDRLDDLVILPPD